MKLFEILIGEMHNPLMLDTGLKKLVQKLGSLES